MAYIPIGEKRDEARGVVRPFTHWTGGEEQGKEAEKREIGSAGSRRLLWFVQVCVVDE